MVSKSGNAEAIKNAKTRITLNLFFNYKKIIQKTGASILPNVIIISIVFSAASFVI